MADADVIPIGGRGRPGRGSHTSPSAAARALAPSAPARARSGATRDNDDDDAAGTPAPTPAARRKRRTGARKTAAPDSAATAGKSAAAKPAPKRAVATKVSSSRASSESGPAPKIRPKPVRRAVKRTAAPPAAEAGPDVTYSADDLVDAVSDAAKEVFGDASWERKLAEFLAFTRRRITGDYEVDEFGFDAEITDRFLMTALRPLAEKWFRIEVRGIDNIPVDGGALVVSNHSGTMPVDGLMTGLVIHDHADRRLRSLGADLVFKMPFVGELARKGGATLASNEDAERMLSRGDLVGVWPEGFYGIGKPFSERYKLQRFGRGGFVSAALRTGVPIVPCSVVGAEEIYPLVGNIPSLARLLGVPYIPITPFFPLLGPLGMIPLPSKWLIEFGEPIRTDSFGEGAADDPMLVFNVTDQVRETIQQTLYSLLIQRRSVFS
jgi:1-acyl-sn-glycerol-3-phosphate acyltransferase